MAGSPKALAAALRRRGGAAGHPQSVTATQQSALASHLPGQAASLPGQARSLPGQASGLLGQASSLPSTVAEPTIIIEHTLAGLSVRVAPSPQDGNDAVQHFPNTPEGRHVAGHYAEQLAHATKLPIADMTGGHHVSR